MIGIIDYGVVDSGIVGLGIGVVFAVVTMPAG